jgi:hypothetical protein
MGVTKTSKELTMNENKENKDRSLNIGLPKEKEGDESGYKPGAKTGNLQGEQPDKKGGKPNQLPGEKRNGDPGVRQGGNIPGS